MSHDPLTGRVILISGAAGGIGSATARRLTQRGAKVVLGDLHAPALDELATELGANAQPVVLDVTDPESCAAAVHFALTQHGRLDAVWANAGISAFGPLELLEQDIWRRVIAVNLVGVYNFVRAGLPAVIDSQGYVAMTASWASFAHSPGHSAYAAAKAGVEALANSLRSELAHQGVRVGVFHPGWIDTPMVTNKIDTQPAFNVMLNSLPKPLRKVTAVEDVAEILANALATRSDKVVYPRIGWALHALRPLLATPLLASRGRKVAPLVRQLYAEQIE